jgi:hypothetical protein
MAQADLSSLIKISCPQLAKTIGKLAELNGNLGKVIARGMNSWAEPIMTEAKKRVPLDIGTLAGSLYVKPAKVEGGKVSVEFGAGGASVAYALAVHEHPSEHSPRSWGKAGKINWKRPGSGPKFLENPINENMDKLDTEVSSEIDKEMAKMKS